MCALQVYRRNLKEFMDVLLKRGRFKDSDDTKDQDGVSEWAPRQFLCPITQVSTVVAQVTFYLMSFITVGLGLVVVVAVSGQRLCLWLIGVLQRENKRRRISNSRNLEHLRKCSQPQS